MDIVFGRLVTVSLLDGADTVKQKTKNGAKFFPKKPYTSGTDRRPTRFVFFRINRRRRTFRTLTFRSYTGRVQLTIIAPCVSKNTYLRILAY